MATCLDTPTAIIPTDTAKHSIVAQRNGVITYTTTDQPNREILRLDVDTSGDGGLASIALSPSYDQDRLIYALITTPTDNRVVRVTPGDVPKTIFSGIPKGAIGNLGSLLWTAQGLIVASGNAGNPAAAADPKSLAGKVFLLEGHGPDRPTTTRVLAINGGVRSSLCQDPTNPKAPVYVADESPTEDTVRVLRPDSAAEKVWSWPERPGALGCGVSGDWLGVSQRGVDNVYFLNLKNGGPEVDGEPLRMLQTGGSFGNFGRIGGSYEDKLILAGTVNRTAGGATPTDDRVVRLKPPDPSVAGGPD
ncbi:PQQ-dependent sugar dehydrogenase [Tsukamurella paurometabola]|uniref:PQQ-dependent sugar dehydrogenase n=1 Tax=Tsukamurella paurometabola TaxID=2061 RepID=A0ABS5NIM1_TSUPA|nr:PQQ-dependent sugar dehydrogenase [Tsukamurella paurometabola]MBS4104136.1 PQQ-dependent sugar dehydrogenase [Tsukamurella paurometabola]